jgi:DNA-binding MarR family transcriptional regulator
MTQLPFSFDSPQRPGRARATDPSTSHTAAASVNATALGERVYGYLVSVLPEGRTTKELAVEMNISRVTVSPRMAPLFRKGLVERTGVRRDGCEEWKAVVPF